MSTHLNGLGHVTALRKREYDGMTSVYVLMPGYHDQLYHHTPYSKPTKTGFFGLGATPRGVCYKCGNNDHIQNYCPLQFCIQCNTHGHHKQSCVAVSKNPQMHYDKNGGPLELRKQQPLLPTKTPKSVEDIVGDTPVPPPTAYVEPPWPPRAKPEQKTFLSREELKALTTYMEPNGSISSLV